MGDYKVLFKPSVEKDLQRLPKTTVARAMGRMEALGDNPFPPACAKLSASERLYRIRVGDYRIVYEVDSQVGVVTIHHVRHRREVYRRLR